MVRAAAAVGARLAPVAVLGATGFALVGVLEPMSRQDLDARRPALRAVAEERAGGAVRGPRVVEGPGAFRLVYRRGRRCRVVVGVDRSGPIFAAAEELSVTVRSRGCRPRGGT